MLYHLSKKETLLRKPTRADGLQLHRLIAQNPPLDPNSVYSYHLLTHHFADTCVVAEFAGEIVGFISAYIVPSRPDTLFVWQVVVDPAQRGRGIARLMLSALLSRPACAQVRTLEATVNPSNSASRALFQRYAEDWGGHLAEEEFLDRNAFGDGGEHESEILLRIALQGQQNLAGGKRHAYI